MKKILLVFIAVIIIAVIAFMLSRSQTVGVTNNASNQPSNFYPNNMTLSSPAFQDGQILPKKYTCDGSNVNPPLQFSDIPAGTKSLALIVDDPDAPSGDFVHWLIWDMDPGLTAIAEGNAPTGTQGKTSTNSTGYVPPCPPSGTHRYTFKLYALDTLLGIPSAFGKEQLLAAMEGHILAQSKSVGLYGR